MRKKVLSLTLALALCLGLTVPALAAEPTDYKNEVIQITNVLDYQMTDKWTIAFTCIAPVKVTPGDVFDRTTVSVEASAEKIPDDAGLTVDDYYEYPYGGNGIDTDQGQTREGESVILTEPGRYIVEIWEETESGGGFTRYLVTVQAGSETAPNVPTTDPTTTTPQTASPTNDALTADGVLQTPTVYKINGSNYFKIRDLAAILNGTSKQFSVGYDGALKSVTATTGQGYTKQPGDLAGAPAGGNKTAEPSNDAIYINGKKVAAEVYKIDGSNYFKLRDLGAALDFYVGYSAETGVFLETDKPYSK